MSAVSLARLGLLVVLAVAGSSKAVAAQELVDPNLQSDPTGFHLGLLLGGGSIGFDNNSDPASGGGFTLRVGYAPNPVFGIFTQLSGHSVAPDGVDDDYTLAHVDVGVRAQLHAPTRRVVPFVEVMYGVRGLEGDLFGDPLTYSGGGLGGTLGAMVFLQPGLALDFGVSVNGGRFTEIEYQGMTEDIDEGATSARVSIGLAWFSR
jgi:hypothetical protein